MITCKSATSFTKCNHLYSTSTIGTHAAVSMGWSLSQIAVCHVVLLRYVDITAANILRHSKRRIFLFWTEVTSHHPPHWKCFSYENQLLYFFILTKIFRNFHLFRWWNKKLFYLKPMRTPRARSNNRRMTFPISQGRTPRRRGDWGEILPLSREKYNFFFFIRLGFVIDMTKIHNFLRLWRLTAPQANIFFKFK